MRKRETVKTCALAFAFLLVVGCTAPRDEAEPLPGENREEASTSNELPVHRWGIGVFTDLNGCQYLTHRSAGAAWVTPRMNPDGTQICEEPSNG